MEPCGCRLAYFAPTSSKFFVGAAVDDQLAAAVDQLAVLVHVWLWILAGH